MFCVASDAGCPLFPAALCAVALSAPHDVKPGGIDDCGAKAVKQFKLVATGNGKMRCS